MSDPFADEDDYVPPAPLSRAELIQKQKQESMARQLDSTQRSMASIWDSEAVGIATAEELTRQGEQLDNIEAKTEKINADTKAAQYHINGIKSVFGGIKNWWNGEKKDAAPAVIPKNNSRSDAFAAIKQERPSADAGMHPALRLRADDSSNPFYDDDVKTFDNRFESGYGGRDQTDSRSRASGGKTGNQQSSSSARSSEWNQYESALNQNLDCMSGGLSQLKLLASGLNAEIIAQNEQVDRIMPKVDRADTKIRDQNRQMRTILGTTDKATAK